MALARRMRFLALGGITGPVLFSVVVIVSAALRPGYSHLHQFISELGAAGTPHAARINYAGFVPTGLMLAAFGIALAFVLLGCPQGGGSPENLVHNTIAPAAFLCLIAAMAMLGIRFRSLPAWRRLSLFSLLASAAALGLLVVLASSLDSRVLTGLWQRLLLAVLFAWCALVALEAFRRAAA